MDREFFYVNMTLVALWAIAMAILILNGEAA